MRRNVLRILVIVAAGVFFTQSGMAQKSNGQSAMADNFVISARAGGISLTDGVVTVTRKDGRSGHLIMGDALAVGDRVSTGPDGRAEILLNPGSYLRLGPNSGFEFVTTSLDDLKLKLDSGSAILEVFAANEFRSRIDTPNAAFNLIESGVFRIDVQSDGNTRISVWEGKAELGDRSGTIVKQGRSATLTGNASAVSKFDRGRRDAFDLWSKTRAKELARASEELSSQNLTHSLMNSFTAGNWGMYDSFGLWVFNRFSRSYCFLPFGQGWQSPYGFGFNACTCYYNLPPTIYLPNPVGGGTPIGPVKTPIESAGDRDLVPPFVKLQGLNGGTRGGGGANPGAGSIFDTMSPIGPTQTSSPTVFTPTPASAPATVRPKESTKTTKDN